MQEVRSLLSTLPQSTRHQLELCGITSDEQLAAGLVGTIYQELQAAKKFFPDEQFDLTESELARIINKAREINGTPEKLLKPLPPIKPLAMQEAHEDEQSLESTAKEEEARAAAETAEFLQQIKPTAKQKINRGAITCGHPFLLLFGALVTLLVPLFLVSLVGFPYMLLYSDYRPLGDGELIYLLIVVLLILPHLCVVRMIHCSVCHMNIFTFRNYPYHSKAHKLPLLGVPVATALRILFCWRYTCPACGTPQKLFGKRSRHRHSHRA